MDKSLRLSGRTIIRNAIFNVIGKAIPMAVGIFSIPFIVSKLGNEQFGILSIIWISFTSYFYLFDFGLGQTVTKFIAESLEKKEKKHLSEIIWTSFAINLLISLALLVFLLPLVPLVVNHVLKISPEFKDMAKNAFFVLVFAFPLTTTFSIVRGILEGAQRYDILNFVKIPFNSLLFLIPAISLFFGLDLYLIVLLLALCQLFLVFAAFFWTLKTMPFIKDFFAIKFEIAKKIISFGKWLTIANLANAFLTTFDRVFVGSLISVAAIGFYSVPFDAVANVLILPQSLIVLFPVFSAFSVSRKNDAVFFFSRIFKHLLAAMGVSVILVIFFARDILNFWLGLEFAQNSTFVLQILALGMFGICFSAVGENLIKGYGKPDILAKLRLVEIIPFFLWLGFFTLKFGIKGTAFVWTARSLIDAAAIIFIDLKLLSINFSDFVRNSVGKTLYIVFGFWVLMLLGKLFLSAFFFAIFAILSIIVFFYFWLYYIIDKRDANFIKSFFYGLKA